MLYSIKNINQTISKRIESFLSESKTGKITISTVFPLGATDLNTTLSYLAEKRKQISCLTLKTPEGVFNYDGYDITVEEIR